MPWLELIELHCKEMVAAGRPPTTVGLRREQLTHVARGVGVPARTISREELVGWFAEQDWAPETRRSYRSAVRTFFAWCLDTGHLAADPALRLPVIKAPAGVPRPIPDDALHAALSSAPPRVHLMLRLAAQAGLRRAEIAALHTGDLLHDPRGFSLLVHGKGGKDRIIPLPDALAVELRAHAGWVFDSLRGGHVSPRWVGQACAAVLPAPWTLHSLRHRFATRAYAATKDLRAVQILLGHTSPAITQRYVGVTDVDLRAAMAAAQPPINREKGDGTH